MEPHFTPNDVIAYLLQIAFKAEKLVATTNVSNGNQHDFPHTIGDVDALRELSDELGVLNALPFNLAQGDEDSGAFRAKHFLASFLPLQAVTHVKIGRVTEEGMAALREALSRTEGGELVPGIVAEHCYGNMAKAQMIDFAVARWNAEVKDRPLLNIHRRTLDGCWRQMIRQCGGDDAALLGPTHDELMIKSSHDADQMDDEAAEKAFWNFDARVKGYNDWQGQPQDQRRAFKAEFMRALRTPYLALEKQWNGKDDWAFCARIESQPQVEAAFHAFADSDSQDNAIGVVVAVLNAAGVPMMKNKTPNDGWVLAKETVIEMPDGKKELGYTTVSGIGVFTDQVDASKSHSDLKLPLGWVVMPINQLIPGYIMPPRDETATLQQPVNQVFSVRNYDDKFVEDLLVAVADISSDGRRFRACSHLFALANSDDEQLQADVQNVVNEVIPLAKQMDNYMPTLAEVREIIDRLIQRGLIADDTAPEHNVNLYATWEVMRQDALKMAHMIVEQYREPVAMQRVICKHCCCILPHDEKDTLSEKHAADCVVNVARQFIEDTDV